MKDNSKKPMLVYGINPVREAVRSERYMPQKLMLLNRASGKKGQIDWILNNTKNVSVQQVDKNTLDKLAGRGNHQGIAAEVKAFQYADLESALEGDGPRTVLLLDGITDPQNLGAVCRSAAAFGADLVVLPQDRSATISPAAARISSGAVFHLDVAKVNNLVRAVDKLKETGFFVYGLEGSADTNLADLDLTGRLAICLGAEDKGLRKPVRSRCDSLVRLPTDPRFPQLNAGSAMAAALHEVKRQKM